MRTDLYVVCGRSDSGAGPSAQIYRNRDGQPTTAAICSFQKRIPPIFHGDMLVGRLRRVMRDWNWRSIEVITKRDSGQPEQRGCDIDMSGNCILHFVLWNARAADIKWDPDILVEPCRLPRWQAVLTNMVAIVGSIEDVGVLKLATLLQTSHQRLNQLIHTL